jgi:hypothetical protein
MRPFASVRFGHVTGKVGLRIGQGRRRVGIYAARSQQRVGRIGAVLRHLDRDAGSRFRGRDGSLRLLVLVCAGPRGPRQLRLNMI